jgi:putative multiple sugar transport system ATP-binding protein
MSDHILEMKHITKTFPGVKALDDVNFSVKKGEIHALVGENGAGKSTLMKVLSGVHEFGTYEGDIVYNGAVCQFRDIKESEKKGIVIIHQELALIPYLSIAENIFLGNEQASKGIIDWKATASKTSELLKRVKLKESPKTLITQIGVGKQQLVEIAKALSKRVELLILDEPTAALNEDDSENLLDLILELKEHGITSILISHKLNEVEKIADSVTILRDGQTIETISVEEEGISEDRIIKGMVGRELTNRFPIHESNAGEKVLEVKNWSVYHPEHEDRQVIKNIDFHLNRGEVLGLAGLMGAGRTELAMSLFGKAYGKNVTGTIIKEGKELHLHSVSDAIKAGFAYVTEDRKSLGLILDEDLKTNISLANLKAISKNNVVNNRKEITVGEEYRKKMNIKSSGITQKAKNLSGGNQQKVVLSKWINTKPDILILDEPTRGIDVGAKYEIYTIINQLVDEGKSVIVISSEMPEILGICDRIYVMSEGKLTGELMKGEATQEKIMKHVINKQEAKA